MGFYHPKRAANFLEMAPGKEDHPLVDLQVSQGSWSIGKISCRGYGICGMEEVKNDAA